MAGVRWLARDRRNNEFETLWIYACDGRESSTAQSQAVQQEWGLPDYYAQPTCEVVPFRFRLNCQYVI